MRSRTKFAVAALVAATSVAWANAYDSQKTGEGYVYAPTTLGSRHPQQYVSEPHASLATGAQPDEAGKLNAIVQALNNEPALQGSKLTVIPDGEKLLLTGVTVTRDQMAKALEIARSQAGEGTVANAITTEELRIVTTPAVTTASLEVSDPASDHEPILPATPDGEKIAPATPPVSS